MICEHCGRMLKVLDRELIHRESLVKVCDLPFSPTEHIATLVRYSE